MSMQYVIFGKEELKRESFLFGNKDLPMKDLSFLNKPSGGLWASPLIENGEFLSAWEEWCYCESFNLDSLEKYVQFKLKETARVLIIDSEDTYIEIMEKYKKDLYSVFHMNRYVLDFDKISKDYDAVFLTESAAWTMHLYLQSRNDYADFNSWDVESIVILNFDAIDLSSCECKINKNYKKYLEELKED